MTTHAEFQKMIVQIHRYDMGFEIDGKRRPVADRFKLSTFGNREDLLVTFCQGWPHLAVYNWLEEHAIEDVVDMGVHVRRNNEKVDQFVLSLIRERFDPSRRLRTYPELYDAMEYVWLNIVDGDGKLAEIGEWEHLREAMLNRNIWADPQIIQIMIQSDAVELGLIELLEQIGYGCDDFPFGSFEAALIEAAGIEL